MPQDKLEQIIEHYNNELARKQILIEELNEELNTISTVSYNSGIPNPKINRGDEGEDFDFPIRWGITCKRMEKSIYLEPILSFFKGIFNTFDYYIEKPVDYETNMSSKLVYDFFTEQFKRAGGLKRLIVDIAYNTLVYGFSFFTPKLEIINGNKYSFKGKLDGLRGFKYYDPTLIYSFIFKEDDSDELQAIKIYTQPKKLGCGNINTNKNTDDYLYEEYLNNLIINKQQKLINIDFDLALAGYCTYGNNFGDPLGKPFLYSAYPLWKVLENMDNSFNRNLVNVGEHSFNFIPHNAATEINNDLRSQIKKEIQEWVRKGGGVFISQYGKIEKIECIDANEWYNFRDGMLSTLFKNKNVDIKSVGLNRGATRNIAELSQTDSIIAAKELIDNFIYQLNNNFMKKFFDLNFKSLRAAGNCDYLNIACTLSVSEQQNQYNNSQQTVSMSAIRKDDNTKEVNSSLTDNQGNTISQSVQYDNGKSISTKTAIPMSTFIKQAPDDITKFIIDTTDLDKILVRSSDELNAYLLEYVKNAMVNEDLIKKSLTKPQSFVRGSLLNKNQKISLLNQIQELLKSDAYSFFQYKAGEILRGTGGLNWKDLFGISLEEWIDKNVKYFLKNKITTITEELAAETEKIAMDNLFKFARGYNSDIDIEKAKSFVLDNIFNWKGKQLQDIVDSKTIYTFQEVSNIANESASEKIDGMAKIRTGVLETMCSHCQKYFGVLYKKDSKGNWYNIDHDYVELPDNNCIGAKYGNKCRCYYVTVGENVLDVINNVIIREANK